MKITGTLINYYFHCKRQCWLFANRVNLEDNSEDVRIGKVLHELNDKRDRKSEISIGNIKVDKITDEYLIEMKKSDADIEAVKWQVLLYLKKLKEKGIVKKGKIEFMEKNKQSKKTHYIDLTSELETHVEVLCNKIYSFTSENVPPLPILQPKCRKCAYFEYCFI